MKAVSKAGFKGLEEEFIFSEWFQVEDDFWRDKISLFRVVSSHQNSPFL